METHDFSELVHRIRVLERRSADLESALNDTTEKLQQVDESGNQPQIVTHQNQLENSEFDMSRNEYLYYYDVTGTGGVDADVSEELYAWYVSEPDTSITAFGAMTATDPTLTLSTADFVGGDATLEIVVEGAGTDGDDLVTTIATYTDTTHVELTVPAVTTVSNARVRWRLLTINDDSTDDDFDADQATNSTVKSAAHTLYATTLNDPDWDKNDNRIRLGSANWLCHPLRQNVIKPSLQYISSFIYRLSAAIGGEEKVRINMFMGIWDDSPGQKCFLESEPIAINAEVQGSPTVTTATDYFIVFATNWGTTIGSQVVTVAAPTAYTDSQYVGLSWIQPAGAIRTDIYRKRGGIVRLLNPPYPQTSYRDKGATRGEALGAFPTVTTTRSQAYMETTEYNFAEANTSQWLSALFNLPIPKTYDASKTTGRQWFIMGLKEAVTDGERSIWIDRVSLDDKPGVFSRSPWDSEAKRNVSSHPQGADIGGFGGFPGGDGSILPGDTDYCPDFFTLIDADYAGTRIEIPAVELVDNEDIYKIINIDGEAVEYTAEISRSAQPCYELKAGEQTLRASENEPVYTGIGDDTIILLKNLTNSSMILGREGMVKVDSNLRLVKYRHTVKITLKGSQKGFWIAGIACHNRKESLGEIA